MSPASSGYGSPQPVVERRKRTPWASTRSIRRQTVEHVVVLMAALVLLPRRLFCFPKVSFAALAAASTSTRQQGSRSWMLESSVAQPAHPSSHQPGLAGGICLPAMVPCAGRPTRRQHGSDEHNMSLSSDCPPLWSMVSSGTLSFMLHLVLRTRSRLEMSIGPLQQLLSPAV